MTDFRVIIDIGLKGKQYLLHSMKYRISIPNKLVEGELY